jgi:hypothetical protein
MRVLEEVEVEGAVQNLLIEGLLLSFLEIPMGQQVEQDHLQKGQS